MKTLSQEATEQYERLKKIPIEHRNSSYIQDYIGLFLSYFYSLKNPTNQQIRTEARRCNNIWNFVMRDDEDPIFHKDGFKTLFDTEDNEQARKLYKLIWDDKDD